MDLSGNNVFLYWVGKEYKLIKLLRKLIYLHSTSGSGYTVHLITRENINSYISDLPACFNALLPAHQADYVRVNVICKYGGIWLDSDIIVLESLDSLFIHLHEKDGFFLTEDSSIYNGIFGSKPNTYIMRHWKKCIDEILIRKGHRISWTEIGNLILTNLRKSTPELYSNYTIFVDTDTLMPVHWSTCVKNMVESPCELYKQFERPFQPVLVLFNAVYKTVENDECYRSKKNPLNYFINKSFDNLHNLSDLDFIEIGTSNFDTLIQTCTPTSRGISVDAIKYYIDCLPSKENVKKVNIAISNTRGILDVYYIPEDVIISKKLPNWFKGCNCINKFHPLHISHKVTDLVVIDKVNVITPAELLYTNSVRGVSYLKIDTEGHDCIILESLYDYITDLPLTFYPKKILFESNEHTPASSVTKIIELYKSIGYVVESRGYDTILRFE
jgi:hypothetical protein